MSKRHGRRGVSLIQCLVLISALATITSLSAVLVCRTQRLTTFARSVHQAERDAWRLSTDLRRAARTAIDVRLEKETLVFVLPEGGGRVFRFSADGVVATQSGGGQRTASDAYRLRGRPAWTLRFDPAEGLVGVEARFPGETDLARHGRTPLRVLAPVPRLRPSREGAP